MLSLPFQNHFDWDKHHFNQDELNLKQTEKLFKKIDEQLWNECDKSIYKPYRFRGRIKNRYRFNKNINER